MDDWAPPPAEDEVNPLASAVRTARWPVDPLGTRRLAVANKWNETINRQLADFFRCWDIEVVGCAAESQEPAHFQRADLRAGAELAYQLGWQALERAEKAEALFIGGGAWLADPAAERLEREFGKPVITSLNGAVRSILKTLGCWRPFPPGTGRVLEVA